MKRTLFINASLVTRPQSVPYSVLLEDGIVTAITQDAISVEGAEVVDLAGNQGKPLWLGPVRMSLY